MTRSTKVHKLLNRFFKGYYKYRKGRYKDSFLVANDYSTIATKNTKVDAVLYCFWTGDNEMSENRKRCFKGLRENVGVEVKLITPINLDEYILSDYPLHPAYEYLSLVHKSDYLRCYFMHFHGGGYSDVKHHDNSLLDLFTKFSNSDSWMLGYPEISPKHVVKLKGRLGFDLKLNYHLLNGLGAFIFKPNTPITNEWYSELNRRMDRYEEKLRDNPGNILGSNEGYPIHWSGILGDILHPLMLKYHDKIMQTPIIRPDCTNYR